MVESSSLIFSTIIGYVVVLGSSLVKVPQVFTVVKSRSAQGLSQTSLLLEVLGLAITVVYCINGAFPFSTFGESLLILIQDVLLGSIIASMSGYSLFSITACLVAFIGCFFTAIFGDVVPSAILMAAQACTIPIFVLSKLPQIWLNWKNGSTGQLSLITCALNFVGSSARIFTTLTELDDMVYLAGFVLGFVLNATLLFQIMWYWNSTHKKQQNKNKSKTQ